jgi:hypothetical protein
MLNRQLLGDDELQWGLGQVLPLVMLLAIIFNVLDTSKGKNNSYDSDNVHIETGKVQLGSTSKIPLSASCV